VFTRLFYRPAVEILGSRIAGFGHELGRGRDAGCPAPTGWPEAAPRLRLPQNVACGFPALRSSEIDLQHSE
jgi:hypothetical protein